MIPENTKSQPSSLILQTALSMLLLLFSITSLAETAFSYQGRLSQSGQPANGIYDMRFNLFDAVTAGSIVGVTLSESGVKVLDGVFNVILDFGEAPFGSDPRWLRIEVKDAGGGVYVVLFPRQRVGASPFAIETLSVAAGAVDTAALQNNAVTTTKIADGNVFTNDLANYAVSTNKLSNQAVTRVKVDDDAIGAAQIENNTVTSSDIRDGTVAAVDLAPGIYRTKADLYEVVSTTMTINLLAESETVSCNDENDLPLAGGCRTGVDHQFLATSVGYENWASSSDAASVTCNGGNIHPSNPTDNPVFVEAYLVCVSVP